ncbi:MAG: cation diffusion facilitator family transporter [bacterium]|nr:cation diffusion facilitator family transporter [bacterium]
MASGGSRLAIIAALVANSTIAVAKFFAFLITGSAAMLAEAIHSVADSSNQGLLLYGSRAARQPADMSHPFGRGKEVYFWGFLVAVMLFFGGGVWAFLHGWEAIAHAEPLGDLRASFIVLSLALVLESISFGVALREFNRHRGTKPMWRAIRESKDASLIVILLEDTAAMLGLIFALVGTTLASTTGDSRWDGAASLLIGVMLAVVAVLLAAEIKALLIGEAAGRQERALIRAVLLGMDEVTGVGRLLTMHLGPDDLLVNVEVDFVESLGTLEIADAITKAEQAIREKIPVAGNIFVEPYDRDSI